LQASADSIAFYPVKIAFYPVKMNLGLEGWLPQSVYNF
jgi:hypothetical protein